MVGRYLTAIFYLHSSTFIYSVYMYTLPTYSMIIDIIKFLYWSKLCLFFHIIYYTYRYKFILALILMQTIMTVLCIIVALKPCHKAVDCNIRLDYGSILYAFENVCKYHCFFFFLSVFLFYTEPVNCLSKIDVDARN